MTAAMALLGNMADTFSFLVLRCILFRIAIHASRRHVAEPDSVDALQESRCPIAVYWSDDLIVT